MLGFAYWGNGNLEAAQRIFADFMQTMQQSGDDSGAIAGTSLLADITIAQGHLNEALRIYRQSLQLVTTQGGAAPRGTSELYAGMGELCCEQGDLEAAAGYLRKSETLGEQAMILGNEYRLYPTLARTKAGLGDLEGALALLDEAERLFYRTPIPAMRPIPAMKVRLWIKQGRLAEALVWVRERNLSVDDDVSYLKEFEHITLARLFIALHRTQPETGNIHQVMDLLERLLKAAEAGKRLGSAIEIRILMALANEAQGEISAALTSIERALMLAEPEGFARIFVDEGPPMTALLREAARQGGAASYARQLLAALKKSPSPVQPLVEPLSERELDVLKLLNTELSGPEIAGELMVSLNTVRTHTKNIYNKLGVNNRRSAVRRAEELNLL
jgi:LuxR family maltose regulon positive regulatory protein